MSLDWLEPLTRPTMVRVNKSIEMDDVADRLTALYCVQEAFQDH